MPRVTSLQTNFTAGELSPRLYGRVDVARYTNGAAEISNGCVLVQGGVTRAYGSRYVAPTKTASKRSRLIPYVFNRTQAYMLEFGDFYMRVFTQSGARVESSPGVPYEIATPYSEAMLDDIDYSQGADTMFLWHESLPTRRLQRFADTQWVMAEASWVNQPTDETGERFNQVATLSDASVGSGRTLTVPVGAFTAADGIAGRTITAGAGVASITAYVSATQLTVTVDRAFASTSLAANSWKMTASPQVTLTPSVEGPVGVSITLTSSDANTFTTARHVGAYVRINDGLVKISSVTGGVATGTVISALSGTTAAPPDAWALEYPVWNAVDGYPRTGTLWEQRLIAAGSPAYPQTVWGTRTGEYFNFSRGVDDADGFAFTIASDEINPIQFVTGSRTLVAFTSGGEFTLQGGVEKPITPTNVQVRPRSNHGCARVRPVKIGREELFVQRAGRKLRAFSYNVSNDDYTAPNITVLSEHVSESGIAQLAWQKEPESWLWALLEDGTLACCTYELQDENVLAWTRRSTGAGMDAVESIATIPDAGGTEQLWAVVARTVAGATVRYVERFDSGVLSDCAVTQGATGGEVFSLSGLSHLNGRDVDVVADGTYLGRYTVSGGAVTLSDGVTAERVEVGLPYTTTVRMLTPELQMPDGSAQGNSMRIGEATVRLLNTVGCTINNERVPTRQLDVPTLGLPPQQTTGLARIENLGWERGDAELAIEQPYPLPFTLLSVIRKITVNS